MIDWDAADKIVLDDEAAGNAVEHANEAAHAGLDDQEQLFAGIRAYLQTIKEMEGKSNG